MISLNNKNKLDQTFNQKSSSSPLSGRNEKLKIHKMKLSY